MEVLRWDKRFSVGNPDIDLQHQRLFALLNALIKASGMFSTRRDMETIVEELAAYTDYHFTFEEDLLKGLPCFEEHHKAHVRFIEKIREFEKAFLLGQEDTNGDLFGFLVEWIRQHICNTDITDFGSINMQTARPETAISAHPPQGTSPSARQDPPANRS